MRRAGRCSWHARQGRRARAGTLGEFTDREKVNTVTLLEVSSLVGDLLHLYRTDNAKNFAQYLILHLKPKNPLSPLTYLFPYLPTALHSPFCYLLTFPT